MMNVVRFEWVTMLLVAQLSSACDEAYTPRVASPKFVTGCLTEDVTGAASARDVRRVNSTCCPGYLLLNPSRIHPPAR
jgi:hypothetical protein